MGKNMLESPDTLDLQMGRAGMKKRVYITRKIPQTGVEMLMERYHVEFFPENRPIERSLLLKKLEYCDALISLLSDRIDEEVLSKANNLKIVANYAVGYNNIDIAAAAAPTKIMRHFKTDSHPCALAPGPLRSYP